MFLGMLLTVLAGYGIGCALKDYVVKNRDDVRQSPPRTHDSIVCTC